MIYAYLDKNIKAANMRELMSSVPNVKFVELKEFNIIPSHAQVIAVHGVLRGNGELIKQAEERGIPWVYMDNAGPYFDSMYKRVILNATAPITFRGGKRFEHNTKLEPWRGGQGDYILVLPPSPPYMDTFGTRDFLNYCAHTINKYTDKPIVIRGKPAKGKFAPPLDEQIDGAYAVVSWGSAVSLEALRIGVPTISAGWCPSKLASFQLEDLETCKIAIEPNREAVFDNLTHYCFRREELPMAYDYILENAKNKRFDFYNIDNNWRI